jgi:predicted metal-binding membrane protein
VSFLVMSLLLLVASVMVTVIWGTAMSAMGGMPMPGGWTMSMAWMRMPGQTWLEAAATFLGMWIVMMVAMMMPSLVPMLSRYRRAVAGSSSGETRISELTIVVGLAYFLVWTVLGIGIYPLGVALAAIEMQHPALARAVPMLVGAVVALAGVTQLARWKTHHLACCREAPCGTPSADAAEAWRHGLLLGRHCSACCGGPIAILLVIGVMDLRAMALVTAAITAERLAPAGARIARAIGIVAIGAGLLLMVRARG